MKISLGTIAESTVLTLGARGDIQAIETSGQSLTTPEATGYLFQIGSKGQIKAPVTAHLQDNILSLTFDTGENLTVEISLKEGYTTFEVTRASATIENVMLGPIPLGLSGTIGEVIGTVRGETLAFGAQGLNLKTLAGFPREYSPEDPLHFQSKAQRETMSTISVERVDYYDCAAFQMPFGSLIQLYCENRNRPRTKTIEGLPEVSVPARKLGGDESVVGMKVALFCVSTQDMLRLLEAIEIGEGLPHPQLEGEWAKTAPAATQSYLISEFGEDNIEQLLDYTEKAGFRYLYHSHPFETWGHFALREDNFPSGDQGLVDVSAQAKARGIGLGLHTLTNFTTTNDPYVTSSPERLATYGTATLQEDISPQDTKIHVDKNHPFSAPSFLFTVRIGKELIRYQGVEEEGESFVLIGCTRGAFDTVAAPHPQGDNVHKLMDHGYRIFFPDIFLQDAYVDRLVELYQKAELAQISFDGLEGCRYTGEDDYACNRFVQRFYDGLGRDIINDASRLDHYLWHGHTRMNWGEPWGEKAREGMTGVRFANQSYYDNNLFPKMMGWYLIRTADRRFEASTLSDIEWSLSKGAGFDAGFALSAPVEVIKNLEGVDEIFDSIRHWETLRKGGHFPPELKENLRKASTEWHLVKEGDSAYQLYPMYLSKPYVCDMNEMQPGQPGGSDWLFENPYHRQSYELRLQVKEGAIQNPGFATQEGIVRFDTVVEDGQYLLYNNGKAVRTDANYHVLEQVAFSGEPVMAQGSGAWSFTCDMVGTQGPEITITYKTYDKPHTFVL